MPFLTALRRLLGGDDNLGGGEATDRFSPDARLRLIEAWGLSDTSHPEFPDGRAPAADPAAMAAPNQPSGYDRDQWRRKLKRVLDHLPQSQAEWDPMLAEGRAVGLDPDWMHRAQVEEFTLLIRRLVADRRVEPQEHRRLDLARAMIGLKPDEAEAIVNAVVAEAESFFGGRVEGA